MKKAPTLTRARFCLDESPAWEGWHVVGDTWNGCENPSFTLDTVRDIVAWLEATRVDFGIPFRIDVTDDGRVLDFTVYGDGSPYEVDTITTDDGRVLYALGNNGWVWDIVPEGTAHETMPDDDSLCLVDFDEWTDWGHMSGTRITSNRDALAGIEAETEVHLLDLLDLLDSIGEFGVWNEAERRLNLAGWDTYNSDSTFCVYAESVTCSEDCATECRHPALAISAETARQPEGPSRVYVSPNLRANDDANPHGIARPHAYRVEVLVGTVYTVEVLAYSADEAREIAEHLGIDGDETAEEVDVDRVVRDVEVLDTFGSSISPAMNVDGKCSACGSWARDCTCDDDGQAWSLYLTINGRRTLAHDGTYSSPADILATYTADGLDRWVLGTVDAVGADWASSVGLLPAGERPTLAEWLGIDGLADDAYTFGWTLAPMTEEA